MIFLERGRSLSIWDLYMFPLHMCTCYMFIENMFMSTRLATLLLFSLSLSPSFTAAKTTTSPPNDCLVAERIWVTASTFKYFPVPWAWFSIPWGRGGDCCNPNNSNNNGISCTLQQDGQTFRITSIDWTNRNFYGTLDPEIGKLSNLESLRLDANNFYGTLPHSIGKLTKLLFFSFEHSYSITGPIPDSIGNLVNLQHLNLNHKSLTGPLPQSIGHLHELQTLHISNNKLSGSIPESIGQQLSKLKSLDLHSNQLTGPIPLSIGLLSQLQGLDLRWNRLSGPLPKSFRDGIPLKYLDEYESPTGLCKSRRASLSPYLVVDWNDPSNFLKLMDDGVCDDIHAHVVDPSLPSGQRHHSLQATISNSTPNPSPPCFARLSKSVYFYLDNTTGLCIDDDDHVGVPDVFWCGSWYAESKCRFPSCTTRAGI